MNARQKAKKYKRLVEQYKSKADAYDRAVRIDLFNRQTIPYRIEKLRYMKLVPTFDLQYRPIEILKDEMATDIGKALLDNNYINWKVEDRAELNCKQYSALINIAVERRYDEQTHSIL